MIEILKNLDWSVLTDVLLSVVPVLICITVHECCHGVAALALGDTTAKSQGRLSLNPFKHLDFFGFVMLVVVGFGWAKPVPVNMMRFKNPKTGMAFTALAGPASNLVLAALFLFLYGFFFERLYPSTAGRYVLTTIYYTAVLSVALAVFNIIPVPPLDGSKVLFSLLPTRWYLRLMYVERYGMLILMLILISGALDYPLSVCRENVLDKLFWFADMGKLAAVTVNYI